jgi:glucosamine--fructose-6-phosphate aminotransferase (isomerizing)
MDSVNKKPPATLEEIYRQAESSLETVVLADERSAVFNQVLPLEQYTDIVFTGCGSSYNTGSCAASAWSELLGRPVASVESSELMHFAGRYLGRAAKPLLIAISRTGRTTEVTAAIEAMKRQYRARAVAITVDGGGPVGSAADIELAFTEAREQSIVMTQAFTSILIGLYCLADGLTGHARDGELRSLPSRIAAALETTDSALAPLARDTATRVTFLGSGPMKGLARESALKLTEMALEASCSYPSLEFRHGPKAALDEKTHVIIFATGQERQYLPSLTGEIVGAGAAVTLIDCDETAEPSGSSVLRIGDSRLSEVFRPALFAHAGQLVACRRAEARGINPDAPRNLERTVILKRSDVTS